MKKSLQYKIAPINCNNSCLCFCLTFNRLYLKWIFKNIQVNLLHIDAAEIFSITFSAKVLKGLINGWVFIFSSSETPYFHPLLVWKIKKTTENPTEMRTTLMSESKLSSFLFSHQTANPFQELLSATGEDHASICGHTGTKHAWDRMDAPCESHKTSPDPDSHWPLSGGLMHWDCPDGGKKGCPNSLRGYSQKHNE